MGEPYRLNKQCITEALAITMSSNNGEVEGHHFIQLDGATIGGPESASVKDIFGGKFIEPIVKSGEPLEPKFWKRYRDDSFDIVWGGGGMLRRESFRDSRIILIIMF